MIKQLVSNIGISGQKSKVVNRPLHFKDPPPLAICWGTHEGGWSSVSH